MNERKFKNRFVASFLGCRAAMKYDKQCREGWSGDLSGYFVVEDAESLANRAWEEWTEHGMFIVARSDDGGNS